MTRWAPTTAATGHGCMGRATKNALNAEFCVYDSVCLIKWNSPYKRLIFSFSVALIRARSTTWTSSLTTACSQTSEADRGRVWPSIVSLTPPTPCGAVDEQFDWDMVAASSALNFRYYRVLLPGHVVSCIYAYKGYYNIHGPTKLLLLNREYRH